MDNLLIKQLREETGVSIMDCKRALEEAGGDMEKAKEFLYQRGLLKADKKASRATKAGIIEAYIHSGGKIGVLLDLRCETDFVAKNELFKELAHNIAMHIAAMSPEYVSSDDVSENIKSALTRAYREELNDSKKPEKIIEQIVAGKLNKRLQEICLLDQLYIKNPDQTIKELIKSYIALTGENMAVERFTRYEI